MDRAEFHGILRLHLVELPSQGLGISRLAEVRRIDSGAQLDSALIGKLSQRLPQRLSQQRS